MRNILVINYSQTGQLTRITESILSPLKFDDNLTIETITLKPDKPFPFPWSFFSFFQLMPEAVYMKPIPLEVPAVKQHQYDLIVLTYQVWFLSPSLPTSSFLQSEQAKIIFNTAPVMTVIGCRGMWLTAQEKVKFLLEKLNAKLVDNVVLTDDCGSGFSFLATPLWMFTGKKKSLTWVPQAGVSEDDIYQARRFGDAIKKRLDQDPTPITEPILTGLQAVTINEKLILSEQIGHRSFKVWGKILMFLGASGTVSRKIGICFYVSFLFVLILTVVPLTALFIKLLSPLLHRYITHQRAYFAQPSGE